MEKYDNANCSDGTMNCPDVQKSESRWTNEKKIFIANELEMEYAHHILSSCSTTNRDYEGNVNIRRLMHKNPSSGRWIL